MKPTEIEIGYDFISLYFKNPQELYDYSRELYRLFKRFEIFPYFELQRKDFAHQPGDIPHFHNGIDEMRPHFHIIYPHKPTKTDLDFLNKWGNRNPLKFDINIPIREI